MNIRIRIGGSGRVTHRCHLCGRPIEGEPRFTHIDGHLVAVHPEELDDGR